MSFVLNTLIDCGKQPATAKTKATQPKMVEMTKLETSEDIFN